MSSRSRNLTQENSSICSLAEPTQEPDNDFSEKSQAALELIGNGEKKMFSGWKGGILFNATLAGAVFLINTVFLILVIIGSKPENGISTFFSGNCTKARRLDLGFHLAINVLSTLLLAASNYAMQVVSSPSRADIDVAHKHQKWLDIGIFSFRNFESISRYGFFIYVLLLLSSLPLHFLYNSVLVSSLATVGDVEILYVTPDYFNFTAKYTPPSLFQSMPPNGWQPHEESYDPYALLVIIRTQAIQGQLKHVSVAECKKAITATFQNNWDKVVFVQDSIDFKNSTTLIATESDGADSEFIPMYNAIDCWARASEADCQLYFNFSLMVCVMIANLIKCGVMIFMMLKMAMPTLVTRGDAIASFLAVEDLTTRSLRYIDKSSSQPKWVFQESMAHTDAKKYWGSSSSRLKWRFSVSLCIAIVGTAAGLFAWGFEAALKNSDSGTQTTLWTLGFGQPSNQAIISSSDPLILPQGGNPFEIVLLVNIPQLALSLGYLLINNLLTDMLGAWEWSKLGKTRTPLRTTIPRGQQRSKYFLQLPYIYAVPLNIIMIGLHYLVSSSFFLVDIVPYGFSANGNGSLVISPGDSPLGRSPVNEGWILNYSPLAILLALSVGLLFIAFPIILSFRKLHPGIPMAGACSALISAACHPPPETDAELLPVKWGVVKSTIDPKTGIGRCSISSGEVLTPVEGQLYY